MKYNFPHLHVIADAAMFTAGALADEAYDRGTLGGHQEAILAVSRGWSLFADNLRAMAFNLEDEATPSLTQP